MEEFRPDNWTEILIDNCSSEDLSLEWIKKNAKFFILSYSDKSAHALLWKVKDTEGRGWSGVRMKREYKNTKGYYMDYDPIYIDVEWAIDDNNKRQNDITSNFEEALELANKHTL